MRIVIAVILVILGALLLLYPAYINHYPLVYSDSGTYIDSGFRNYVPADRPIMYGLLVRHFSLAESLWLTVFFQSILISAIIYITCRQFIPTARLANIGFTVSIILLTACSGLPWITGWIMPDVFSGVSFLLLIVLLLGNKTSRTGFAILAILYYIITLTHLSNILSHLALVCTAIITVVFLNQKYRGELVSVKRAVFVALLVMSNYLILPTVNYAFSGGFVTSKGSNIFLTARFCSYGLLKDYLDKNCEQHNYQICLYKDSLPADGGVFLWDYQNSPLYKIGGWEKNSGEFSEINSAILKEPAYLAVFFQKGLKLTWQQLRMYDAGLDYARYDTNSAPYGAISWHLKKDRELFNNSLQNTGALDFNFGLLNGLQDITLAVCLMLSVILMILLPFRKIDAAILAAIILLFANAAVCAFLSDAGNRYQLRVVWIVFVFTIIQFILKREEVKTLLRFKKQ